MTQKTDAEEERLRITQEAVDDFVAGAFQNVAIQLHFGAVSHDRQLLMHYDHVFSALHMAVTLNGQRTTGFAVSHKDEVCLELAPGSC